jgi:N-acetylmuramic acid 6-phosphate etherase
MTGTESIDPRYADIDSWPTEDAIAAMVEGQRRAVDALAAQVAALSAAAKAAAARLGRGDGRLIYAGAGTSGRVAVQDGVELTPTFGWPGARLAYLMAGGLDALTASQEGAEDDRAAAAAGIAAMKVGPADVVIAVAASGHTPFTLSAVEAARARGALTIGLANNPGAPLLAAAEHPILLDTGSEVISGSTRMNAGTAQKAALNILSTAIMLRLGKVYRGQMVDMIISNIKLRQRAITMIRLLAGCDEARASGALAEAGDRIAPAVLIAMGQSAADAQALLARHGGVLRDAVAALRGPGAR